MRAFVLSSLPILQPLMIFCTHALHMRDSRSCGIIIRVLSSIVPEFAAGSDTDSAIREHVSSAVLQEAITSLHDPYFVDVQRDLAQLIATIYITYAPLSPTPHAVLRSLPSITEERLQAVGKQLFASPSPRHQRALVLDLLEGVRGVSVSEQGRIMPRVPAPSAATKKGRERSGMLSEFMADGQEGGRGRGGQGREGSVDLGGVEEMFG